MSTKKEQTIAEVEAILAEVPSLPTEMRAEQKALQDARSEMKTWLDGVKVKDASGAWTGKISATAEEFNRRELDLAAKTAAFQEKVKPLVADHQLSQQKRVADLMGMPQREFSFGAGKDGEIGAPVKSLYQHMEESDEIKTMLEQVPSQPTSGWLRRATLKGVNTRAIMTPEQYARAEALKTQLTSSAGGYPMPLNRTGLIVPFAHRRPVVTDIIPSMDWEQQYFVYMEIITWTNNAAPVAEGAAKPESALGWAERTIKLEVIAHSIPITKQVLKFGPNMRDTVEREMVDMLRLKEEDQVIGGTGTTPQLTGITTRSGIQTYAKTVDDNNLDAIFQSMQQVRFVGYAEPDHVFLNPANFTPIALMKDANGNYIYGDPASPSLQTVWGKPYTQTVAMTAGTSLTGDFGMYAQLLRGGDVIVELGYVNDQLTKNALTLLVEEYVALVVKRAAAFSTTTALD